MGRTVSALVTCGDDYLGAVGPFGVDIPWWAEAEPVAAGLREILGVPVIVLRLLRADGGDGSRDGHVTYHAAALSRPEPGLLASGPAVPAGLRAELDAADELRSPWARLDGVLELLGWATDVLAAAGRGVTGPAVQRKAWNLAALFRLPTGPGPVWLKATPRFAADEASVIAAFARVDPALVPPVIGAGPGRVLLGHLPGEDCWDASPEIITSAVSRLATAQSALAGQVPALGSSLAGLPDRRTPAIAGQIRALLDGPVAGELSTSATPCSTGCGPVTTCLRSSAPAPHGPGSRPGPHAFPAATRPARCASPRRSPTSPTPCATRNSSMASSPRNGSTTAVTPPPPSGPPCAPLRTADGLPPPR